ncbi:MAG: hypothetical protein AAF590_13755, partial [Pseudomonadota bacterium]
VVNLCLIVVSLTGWWVCLNKKDQLNMKRTLSQLRKTLKQWTDAQQRLESAIVGIKMNDKQVQDIQNEISASLGDIKQDLERLSRQQGADIIDTLRDTVAKLVTHCQNLADDVMEEDDYGQPGDGKHLTEIGVQAFHGLLVHMLDPMRTPRYLTTLQAKGVQPFLAELDAHNDDANRLLGVELHDYLKKRAAEAATTKKITAGSLVNELVDRQVALIIMLGADTLAKKQAADLALLGAAGDCIKDVQDAIKLRILTYRRFAEQMDRLKSANSVTGDNEPEEVENAEVAEHEEDKSSGEKDDHAFV